MKQLLLDSVGDGELHCAGDGVVGQCTDGLVGAEAFINREYVVLHYPNVDCMIGMDVNSNIWKTSLKQKYIE